MKGYVFTYGVDGFGADVAPAHEEGVYLNFDKAFAHLVELNHKQVVNSSFYERGYGVDYYPEEDEELAKADANEDWDLFEKLLEKHSLTNEIEINKQLFVNCGEPGFGYYGLEEIEVIE